MRQFLMIAALFLLLAHAPCLSSRADAADAPAHLAIRVETLTVPPATRPLLTVVVRNPHDAAYSGRVAVKGPDGWRIAPADREVNLAAGETQRVAFSIEQARNAKANEYAFEVSARDATSTQVHRQLTFVASAPYFKPTIDGDSSDWEDAIPLTFSQAEHKTVIRTFWNRRRFSVLVAVQEDRRVLHGPTVGVCDAVQLALAPLDDDHKAPAAGAGRYEFLLTAAPADAPGSGRCFQLAGWDTPTAETQRPRPLASLEMESAEVAVWRNEGWTWYECSLPFSAMRDGLQPSEGREFLMSVLVHDPDGTGIRDLGQAAGLWPGPADATGWSRWPGADWKTHTPRSPHVRWGFCTSKY